MELVDMTPKQEVSESVAFLVVWIVFKTVGDTDGSRQTDTLGLYKLGHALELWRLWPEM